MTKISFDALGLELSVEGHRYQNLGAVNNVEEFSRTIYDSFNKSGKTSKAMFGEGVEEGDYFHGRFMAFKVRDHTEWFTFYDETGNLASDQIFSAHEQAHVCHAMGKTDILKRFVNIRNLRIFDRYWDFHEADHEGRELVANIVAFKAAELRGHRILDVPPELILPSIAPALCIYQRAAFHDYSSYR